MASGPVQPSARPSKRRGVIPGARGGAAFWLMASALGVSIVLVVGLIGLIAFKGSQTFWPAPLVMLEIRGERDGEDPRLLVGREISRKSRPPAAGEIELIEAIASETEDAEARLELWITPDGEVRERLIFVGNRDIGPEGFRWLPDYRIIRSSEDDASLADRADSAVMLERLTAWGVFMGELEGVTVDDWRASDAALLPEGFAAPEPGSRAEFTGSQEQVREATVLAIDWATRQRNELASFERRERTPLTRALTEAEVELRRVELAREATLSGGGPGMPLLAWVASLLGAAGLIAGAVFMGRRTQSDSPSPLLRVAVPVAWIAAIGLGLFAALEHPWASPDVSEAKLTKAVALHDAEVADLQARAEAADARLATMRSDLARVRVLVRDPFTGRLAPESLDAPLALRADQITRMIQPNTLVSSEKWGVYWDRWKEFLREDPRENGAGGVFPVIIGTVTLTLLLTVAVAPLGVLAAIYLREYAHQGALTSAVRIAINNLAGVPSIVYGVFGLGFFCYTVGRYIDEGPGDPMAAGSWWMLLGVLFGIVAFAFALSMSGRAMPGKKPGALQTWAKRLAGLMWVGAVVCAAIVIAETPYFKGAFVAEKSLGRDVMQGRGLLWASLTLALLTLPVVIVSTEEAIAAVPNSLREGSLGCGASKWQTVRKIVLPGALPGILTGSILAIARGAGEVAPLMLVGAAKVARELPVSGEFPFIHGDRSFMHLGYHIYDVGFKSPDADAARPLVWTTTLLLIAIVLSLNLAAIILRARLGKGKQTAI